MANQTELLNVSDEMKLNDVRQDLCELERVEELCSSSSDTTEELYSSSAPDTCGDGCVVTTHCFLGNLNMALQGTGETIYELKAGRRILQAVQWYGISHEP